MASPPLDASWAASEEASWNDLRTFLAVVAHGSMNGAARATGQTQPTVARRIRTLEETLGVTLFQRGPNRLDLTEAGRAVLEASAPMAEAARAVPRVAAAYRPDPSAPVRITATSSVTMFLSVHAAELAKAAGAVEIVYIPTRRKLDLASGEADIALRMRRLSDDPDLVARRLGSITFGMYDRSTSPSAVIAPPEDPSLSYQADFVARFVNGRPIPIAARIGDMPIRYQAAKTGLGAAFLPCWLGDADPDLVRLEAPDEFVEDIFMVRHARTRNRPNVGRVAHALTALFKRHGAVLSGEAGLLSKTTASS
ncbi:LysR family transcriptional regulator [Microvirga alba]|uniref:LysR family transcriptional regulator n=1 Tax=Microvirga alba TaxID=2791025 RepID=A0A931BS45_9HYPH|nr:LysR family transcriptional regulator [Microvirga alba]MBF9231827.1 LysR family transcriptional regulator [Microvirga alba]